MQDGFPVEIARTLEFVGHILISVMPIKNNKFVEAPVVIGESKTNTVTIIDRLLLALGQNFFLKFKNTKR